MAQFSANQTHGEKQRRLAGLTDANGQMVVVAADHRGNLRAKIEQAAGRAIADQELAEFKTAVTELLSPQASAVLLDPEYGRGAAQRRAAGCGLLLAYEKSGYDNTRPGRRPDLLPRQSVARLREAGGEAIKILLHYSDLEGAEINDEKRAFVERIGAECRDQAMPFFLEIITYDPEGPGSGAAWARQRPELIARAAEEFSAERYGVDVLKLELPVAASLCRGAGAAYSEAEAMRLARAALAPARRPVVFLSGGAGVREFTAGLELVAEAGVRFAGALCGRAIWQDGIAPFAAGGREALDRWLETEGRGHLATVAACLARCAVPVA